MINKLSRKSHSYYQLSPEVAPLGTNNYDGNLMSENCNIFSNIAQRVDQVDINIFQPVIFGKICLET